MAVVAISTCAYLDQPLTAAVQRVAALATAVEVRCKGGHGIDTVTQNRAVAACGLRCSIHAPEGIEIWSAGQRRRRAAIMAHRRLLEACAHAGAELYLIHPDYAASPVARRAETRATLRESFAELREIERDYPVRIAVENMPGLQSSHFVAPDLDLGGLSLALDAGHAQISGNLAAFMKAPRIAHLHLHDNLGFRSDDLHLPLGRGRMAPFLVRRLVKACDGLCVLEHARDADVCESLGYLDRLQLRREVA